MTSPDSTSAARRSTAHTGAGGRAAAMAHPSRDSEMRQAEIGGAESTPAADAHAVDVLHRLVATPSVSGDEAAAVGVFGALADALGLASTRDEAGNGLALRPSRGPELARIVLLGHIDTVPGSIPVRMENGVLHGRGSVDAKGPLAAMLVAAARAPVHHGVTLEVIAAVGEETASSPGARFVAPRRRPAACIIGEPSGWDGVTLGYKGRLRVRAEVAGSCAHSAGPDGSACDSAHEWWSRVRGWVDGMNRDHRGTFDTLTASMLSMQSGDDGLNQWARVTASLRLPPWLAPDDAAGALPRFNEAGAVTAAFTGCITIDGRESAYAVDRNDAVARALSTAIRACGGTPRPQRKSGTSDMNVVGPLWKCPITAYGPGDSSLDHTPAEHLSIDEYLKSIRVLAHAIGVLSGEITDTEIKGTEINGVEITGKA